MGLDMYLNAERRFDPVSFEAQAVLQTVGLTLRELEALAQLDPMQDYTYVYLDHWNYQKDTEEYKRAEAVLEAAGLLPFTADTSGGGSVSYKDGQVCVSITCAYWRKANAIHSWFVENIQDGVDDCQTSDDINYELLALLASHCRTALDAYAADDFDKAQEILTPKAGFFFGPAEVNEWWAQNATYTAERVELLVNLAIQTGGVSFNYESSW